MGGYDDWLTIAGFGGVVLLGYFMHTRGIFNEIFDAISKGLEDIKKAKTDSDKEEPKEDGAHKDTCPSIPCAKGFKCVNNKCVKESKFVYAYIGQAGPHRAYKSY